MWYIKSTFLLISLRKNELYGLKHVLVNDIQMESTHISSRQS